MKYFCFFSAVLFSTTLFVINCSKEKPGPISVDVNISPSVVENGEAARLEVTVTNMGGEVEIERVYAKEEIISGSYSGQYFEGDLPLSNTTINAHGTEEIYATEHPLYNFTGEDVKVQLTVTVYSNGGNDEDEFVYTIKSDSAQRNTPLPMVKAIIIKLEE